MALQASVSIDRTSYAAGSTPPPQVRLTVYNPTASTVVVTGVQYCFWRADGLPKPTPSAAQMVAPVGLGATVAVPSLSSIIIGPTALAAGMAGTYSNRLQSVTPDASANNPEPSQVLTYTLVIGAYVMGSDGSINQAAPAGILVCPSQSPYVANQRGVLAFSYSTNLINGLVTGVV